MGIYEDQVVVMIHTGSRGLGYQVSTDVIREIKDKLKTKTKLYDNQLRSPKFNSEHVQK